MVDLCEYIADNFKILLITIHIFLYENKISNKYLGFLG